MKYLKTYKIFENNFNESLSEDRDDVTAMLYDLEDYGYGYLVNSSNRSMIPSNGEKFEILDIHVWRKNQETILLEHLEDRIKQIDGIIDYELMGVTIGFELPRSRRSMDLKFDSLDDFSIEENIENTKLHEVKWSILEYGMNEWIYDMSFKCKGDWGDSYIFKSDKQFDDFEVEIHSTDVETDARPIIRDLRIKFEKKLTENIQ